MAEKEPLVVIKKITVVQGGHHGGAWKVAFADFMTALMAFFLVMWLVSQSEEVKKNVADYFGTPSIIEYNFSNYGVELTLEKLFLDLVNEPLRFFEQFIRPVDLTPNIMNMGTKKIVIHHIADQLADKASNVEVTGDTVEFEIEDKYLFFPGTARMNSGFVGVMEKVRGLTQGLEDSNVFVESMLYTQSVDSNTRFAAKNVAEQRLDILTAQVDSTLESPTVDIYGKTKINDFTGNLPPGIQPNGRIKFKIKHKKFLKDGSKPRELKELFGEKDAKLDVYDNFVKQLTDRRRKPQSLPEDLPEKKITE